MMGSWEVPARGYVDCGRQTGAEQTKWEQLARLYAVPMWEGSVGGSELSHQAVGPRCMRHTTDPSDAVLFAD